MAKHIFVVQTNAVAGREDEYNDWYTNIHLPDALAVPGFVSAQRFKISSTQRAALRDYPYQYLTIYEMEGDPAAALEALGAAVPGMQISTAMDADRMLHVFESVTDDCAP
jgi:hypothetical protein